MPAGIGRNAYAVAQLLNPAGSNALLTLEEVTFTSTANGQVLLAIIYGGTGPVTLANGGAAYVVDSRNGSTLALPAGQIWHDNVGHTANTMGPLDILASAPFTFRPNAVLTPGSAFYVEQGVKEKDLRVIFRWRERAFA